MTETHRSRDRSFLVTLLVVLLVCAVPVVIAFLILRAIRRFFRRLGGRGSEDAGSQVAVRDVKRRARKAKAAYDAANRKLQRASSRLAKAEAALEAVQGGGPDTSPNSAAAPRSSPAMFWFNVGKTIAKFLIERQIGKLP